MNLTPSLPLRRVKVAQSRYAALLKLEDAVRRNLHACPDEVYEALMAIPFHPRAES